MVSRAGVVYVVGDVHKPSGVIMDNGRNDGAASHRHGRRHQPDGQAEQRQADSEEPPRGRRRLPCALKDMLASKAPDVRLQAEDIIFVPTSAAKSASRTHSGSDHSNRNRIGHLWSALTEVRASSRTYSSGFKHGYKSGELGRQGVSRNFELMQQAGKGIGPQRPADVDVHSRNARPASRFVRPGRRRRAADWLRALDILQKHWRLSAVFALASW